MRFSIRRSHFDFICMQLLCASIGFLFLFRGIIYEQSPAARIRLRGFKCFSAFSEYNLPAEYSV